MHHAPYYIPQSICPNLDQTQSIIVSPPATADPGVVFEYASIQGAIEEGFGAEVFEVAYQAAVRANHSQELELGARPPSLLLKESDHIF